MSAAAAQNAYLKYRPAQPRNFASNTRWQWSVQLKRWHISTSATTWLRAK